MNIDKCFIIIDFLKSGNILVHPKVYTLENGNIYFVVQQFTVLHYIAQHVQTDL